MKRKPGCFFGDHKNKFLFSSKLWKMVQQNIDDKWFFMYTLHIFSGYHNRSFILYKIYSSNSDKLYFNKIKFADKDRWKNKNWYAYCFITSAFKLHCNWLFVKYEPIEIDFLYLANIQCKPIKISTRKSTSETLNNTITNLLKN